MFSLLFFYYYCFTHLPSLFSSLAISVFNSVFKNSQKVSVKTTYNNVHYQATYDYSKVAASACERVSMGRPSDVPATSVMGYDQTDDFGMVCFVPPTSSVCRDRQEGQRSEIFTWTTPI